MAHQKKESKKKKKKEKTGKEKKIVIHSEGFLKEQFADTQVWAALMPRREGANEDENNLARNDLFAWLLFLISNI